MVAEQSLMIVVVMTISIIVFHVGMYGHVPFKPWIPDWSVYLSLIIFCLIALIAILHSKTKLPSIQTPIFTNNRSLSHIYKETVGIYYVNTIQDAKLLLTNKRVYLWMLIISAIFVALHSVDSSTFNKINLIIYALSYVLAFSIYITMQIYYYYTLVTLTLYTAIIRRIHRTLPRNIMEELQREMLLAKLVGEKTIYNFQVESIEEEILLGRKCTKWNIELNGSHRILYYYSTYPHMQHTNLSGLTYHGKWIHFMC